MKKMIFGAAALMIGGVVLAQDSMQDSADFLQQGPRETVMNKSANANANAAETYQLGNNNKVRVAQAGTLQTAYVSQDNGSTGVGANLAMIQQTGEVGPLSGVENAAEIKQSGEANAVRIGQQGDKNEAVAYQGNGGFNAGPTGDKSSTGNVALIQQGDGEQAEFNASETYQDGDTNFIFVEQTSDRNTAFAEQIGDDNKLVIDQNSAPNLSDGHLAVSSQFGNRNEGVIDQKGTAQNGGDTGANTAQLAQSGDDNSSKQLQNTIANEGVQGETGRVYQGLFGSSVRGNLDNDGQANAGGSTNVFDQLNEVDSALDLNGIVSQGGSVGAEAIQMQTGKMNAAAIAQFGGSLSAQNRAQQNQSGWNQDALIVQNGTGSEGNYAFQDQSDDDNVAAIGQDGGGNMAQQVQDGKRNNAFSSQVGDDHKVSTLQTGNDSRLETLQNGTANAIVISQADGQSAWVEQNAGEGAAFGGNQAGIIQVGPNGSFPSDLGDATLNCNFTDIMDTPPIQTSTFTINDLCPDCN